jgi:Xaa-Pro aminopeptidase
MDLSAYDARPFAERRARLAINLGRRPALIASGVPRPRNYLGNPYPFRASSHFLYLFGLSLRGAFGHFDGEAWAVYMRAPDGDGALWHGPEPGLGELSAALGVPVRRAHVHGPRLPVEVPEGPP